jgi:hypothetical protein
LLCLPAVRLFCNLLIKHANILIILSIFFKAKFHSNDQ